MPADSYPITLGYRVLFWFGGDRQESQIAFADVLKAHGSGACDLNVYPINGGTPIFMRNCRNVNDREWIETHREQANKTGAWDYHPAMPAPKAVSGGSGNNTSNTAPLQKHLQGAGK